MRKPRMGWPSPAAVIAGLALFVALGSGAYATHTHRMGTQDLQNRAVTSPKVANDTVINRTINNGAITVSKFRPPLRQRIQQIGTPPAGESFFDSEEQHDLSGGGPVGDRVTVGEVTVGPGSHVVNGQVMLFSPHAPSHSGLCELLPGEQDRISVANAALGTNDGKVDRSVMTLTGAATVDEETEVRLECRIDGTNRDGTMAAMDVSITAVEVELD